MDRSRLSIASCLLLATCLAGMMTAVSPAHAVDLQTFDLTYAPTDNGGGGSIRPITSADPAEVATAVITLDLDAVTNPGESDNAGTAFVTAFSLTISGAGSGNGTFDLDDFNGTGGDIFLDTNGGTLDFSQQLVGQATQEDPYGTPNGNGGDFNFFGNDNDPTAPDGETFFTFATDGGDGDSFVLTSFLPVPEPSSLLMGGVAALGMGAYGLRRRRSAA